MKKKIVSGNTPKRNIITRFLLQKRIAIVQAISGIIVLLFLYTGANKFFSFQHFTDQLNNQVFPNSWTPYLVWMLPTIEIVIAIALMFEKTKLSALWGSLILMSLFTIYTGLVLFGAFERVPCSCGGVIEHLTWSQHLAFNLSFVGISVMGIYLWKRKVSEIPIEQGPVYT